MLLDASTANDACQGGTLDRVLTLCYYKWLVKESTKLQRTLDRRKERTFLGRISDRITVP